MDLFDARRMAVSLMREHGLAGWRLTWDRARTRAGHCRHDRHEISLSTPLTRLNGEDEVRETVLHEIAHALVGPAHGHDETWRETARRIGCTGSVTLRTERQVPAAWVGTCPIGHEHSRHRRPARPMACAVCSPVFDPTTLLEWRYRGALVPMTSSYRAEEAEILRSAEAAGAVGVAVSRGA